MLIADDVIRFTVMGTYAGRPWANIWDMIVNDDTPATRQDAALIVGKRILEGYYQNLRTGIESAVTVQKVRWVDLDSSTGGTGETSDRETGTGSFNGLGSSGNPLPPNVALLVKKVTSSGRGGRHGRSYIPGIPEANENQGSITAGVKTAWQGYLDAFFNKIDDNSATTSTPCVVHTQGGQVVTGVTTVTSLQVQDKLATQRRRLRP